MTPHEEVRAARDLLLRLRDDYPSAAQQFRWPRPETVNFGRDWFDVVAGDPATADRPCLRVVGQRPGETPTDTAVTYTEMSRRSDQVAGWLAAHGVGQGDRLLLMLGNRVELWEVMLAATKLGAVMIPTTTMLGATDLEDRIRRADVRHVIAAADDAATFEQVAGDYHGIVVGGDAPGWTDYTGSYTFDGPPAPVVATSADDPLLLYFTSGTTARPKLVEHTHRSYPVGHLSTMYWLGLQPGDVHLNISGPGWAKHAWSCFFAPWLAEATVLVHDTGRFDAAATLRGLDELGVTTFCAPPTVWRFLVQEDLGARPRALREVVSAGEPLNPEVIEQVREGWDLTVRDGFGQTETTAQVGNPPGQPVVLGSMGRALPGYSVVLVDVVTGEPADEGEVCLELDGPDGRPVGLMTAYRDDAAKTAEVMAGGRYHTGDVARRDPDGSITYVGRADDVFKSSDYRISPFELESVLVEHPAVAEAAVVPSPDPMRLSVPKAFVTLAAGHEPDADTARAVLQHCRDRLPPYARVRRLQFTELPKTVSGKIRRVELRGGEAARRAGGADRDVGEWWDQDFPELRSSSG